MELKTELINHLKTKQITNVCSLWDEAKNYYEHKHIEMGGGYASWGDDIGVVIRINGKTERFRVKISECE